MRLLDLFCGAGGAAMGYHRAGFDEIVGVDTAPQPRYPFEFVQADALDYVKRYGREFDAIHASPPCQAYSRLKGLTTKQHPQLVEATRCQLRQAGKPYVIENVPGSPLLSPITLCGTMFGLKVIRHRLFETSWQILMLPGKCNHVGRAGTFRDMRRKGLTRCPSFADGYAYISVTGNAYLAQEGRDAMGIQWMVKRELSQAIPPAYTQWIGGQLVRHLNI